MEKIGSNEFDCCKNIRRLREENKLSMDELSRLSGSQQKHAGSD